MRVRGGGKRFDVYDAGSVLDQSNQLQTATRLSLGSTQRHIDAPKLVHGGELRHHDAVDWSCNRCLEIVREEGRCGIVRANEEQPGDRSVSKMRDDVGQTASGA